MKEFVFLGHPDKQADLVADLLVERALNADPYARCAIEVMLKGHGKGLNVFVAGETSYGLTMSDIRRAVSEAHRLGTLGRVPEPPVTVVWALTEQSPYIANNMRQGVGDQAIVVGAAFAGHHMYHMVSRFYDSVFSALANTESWTGDGKVLVSEDASVITLSLSGDLAKGEYGMLEEFLRLLADSVFMKNRMRRIVVNPPGRASWRGGPLYDCGVTGRKLACDAHGVYAPHGGGSTSGKDMTKPDRSMKMLADRVAKRVLSMMLGDLYSVSYVHVTLGYQMGDRLPISVSGTSSMGGSVHQKYLDKVMKESYDEILREVTETTFSADVCHPWVAKTREYMESK